MRGNESNARVSGGANVGTGRRMFLQSVALGGAAALLSRYAGAADSRAAAADSGTAAGTEQLVRYPEKTDLILLTDRPPNLETPRKWFREDLTPNEAFFVRWHLGVIPTTVDPATFRLNVGGHVGGPLSLSLKDLRQKFEPVSLVAVNQCSGNSRSSFEPRVPGGQWGDGAMGNAKWTGVRLKDVLAASAVKAKPVDVTFQGLDRGPMPTVPDFVKSLPFDRANDGEVMIAYAMNDKPLPMLNGYPLRLVVPGWYGTYWVKSLTEINVTEQEFKGFWMAKAYRVPKNPECEESPTDLAKDTVPIGPMTVRSLFVSPDPDQRVSAGKAVEVQGLAMDSGKGIRKVEVSSDDGKNWQPARLDPELGKYSWRRWRFEWTPRQAGKARLQVKATNAAGETQVTKQWNRSGYARNVIQTLELNVA